MGEVLDVIDRKIVDQLRTDGRRPLAQIGRFVGLSEAGVRARYNRLVSLGVVRVVGITSPLDQGEISAHVTIRVRKVSVDQVAQALIPFPEVIYVSACLGSGDIIVELRCADPHALGAFLSEKLRSIPGIASVSTATLTEIVKDSYVWGGF